MRVALAQFTASLDPAENLETIRRWTVDAAEQGVDLVVFPEASMCSFARPRADAAEDFDGAWANAVRAIARETGVTIVVGMFTTTDGPKVHNTLLVTGPQIETRYDKLHLFDALGYAESRQIEAGASPSSFVLAGHGIGLATCYDARFPGLFTHLASAGAELIVVPSSWAPGENKLHQWRTLVTARAMDSTSFVVAVDQALPAATEERAPTGIGHSLVVDPTGNVLLELGETEELAFIDLDLSLVATARERLPVLRHARRFD